MGRTAAIKAFADRLASIPNIGKVLLNLGNAVSEVDRKARYAVDGKYRAWEVTCRGSEGVDAQAEATERTYEVVAFGYFSFENSGEGEAALQTLCEAIEDEFDPVATRTFDGKFSNSWPVKVDGPVTVTLAGALVYGVIVTCRITEYPRY